MNKTKDLVQKVRKIISVKRTSLALVIVILLEFLLPPLQTLSELGVLTIAPNQFITASEIPEYIYEHQNKDFSAYFGSSIDKTKSIVKFLTQGKSFEWSLLPKDFPATSSATPSITPIPESTPSAIPTESPTASSSPTPTSILTSPESTPSSTSATPTPDALYQLTQSLNDTSPQGTLAAQMLINQMTLNQEISTISSQTTQIASETAQIQAQIQNITQMELIRGHENDTDFIKFNMADGNMNIKIIPTQNGLNQAIYLADKNYKWPIVFQIDLDGLIFEKNNLNQYVFIDAISNNPLVNLGTFSIYNEKGEMLETIIPEYSIENSRLVFTLRPSDDLMYNDTIAGALKINNDIAVFNNPNQSTPPIQKSNPIMSSKYPLTFSESADTYKYAIDRPEFKSKLFDKDGNFAFSFEKDGKSVELTLGNQLQKTVTKNQKNINNKEFEEIEAKNIVQGDVDIRYRPLINGVKEEIILNNKTIINSLPTVDMAINNATISALLLPVSFNLTTKGVTPLIKENGEIVFIDDKGSNVFKFNSPYAEDAKNNSTYNVRFLLTKENKLNLLVDKNWLEQEERSYPIIIDPTATITSATASFDTASGYSFQRKTWFDGTRYWAAFSSGTQILFYWSTTGSDWSTSQVGGQNTSATISHASYDEAQTTSYVHYNGATANYDTLSGTATCEAFSPTVNGKVAKIDVKLGAAVNTSMFVIKASSGGACSSPGSDITTRATHVHQGDGSVVTFEFGDEGAILDHDTVYCACGYGGTGYWYKQNTTTNKNYLVVYQRLGKADFAVYGDSQNAYIVYQNGDSDIIAQKAASYPAVNFTWGSEVTIFDGGTAGADGDVRFDFPNIASASGTPAKLHITARKKSYAGSATVDYSDPKEGSQDTMVTTYTNAWWQQFEPSRDGTIASTYIKLGSTAPSQDRTIYCKLCLKSEACSTCAGYSSGTGTTGTSANAYRQCTFSTAAFVSQEKSYKICMRVSGTTIYVLYGCQNQSELCQYGKQIHVPLDTWYGLFTNAASAAVLDGKTTNLDLADIQASFADKTGNVGTTLLNNSIITNKNGDVLFIYGNAGTLSCFTYDLSADTYSTTCTGGSLTLRTGTGNSAARNITGIADTNGNFHIAYIDSTSGYLYYNTLSSDLTTWGTEVAIDSNAGNTYANLIQGTGNNVLFLTWIRGANLYFARKPIAFGQWSSAVSLNASVTNSDYLSTLFSSSEQIVLITTDNSSNNYSIKSDVISTGLNKQMRHGRTFENDTKQPAAY